MKIFTVIGLRFLPKMLIEIVGWLMENSRAVDELAVYL